MRVIVRPIPSSFGDATRAHFDPAAVIHVGTARAEHAQYERLLTGFGGHLLVMPVDDGAPDSVFVEDLLVIGRGRALVARSGNPGRRAEAQGAEAWLAMNLPDHEVHVMAAPACLDGGDVLRVGDQLYVGRSARTNEAGIAALQACFAPVGLQVQVVPVPESSLHLKCLVSAPSPDLVLIASGQLDPSPFMAHRLLHVPTAEAYAANVVGFGGRVVMPEGYPRTAELLATAGLEVFTLNSAELRKADGSMTCCSVLVDGGS